MDILSNRKKIVISEFAPEDTNVIWASGDFTNPEKISITSMKQFVNGSWTEMMESSGGGSDVEEVINKLPRDMKIAFADPDIYVTLLKIKISDDAQLSHTGHQALSPFQLYYMKNTDLQGSFFSYLRSFTNLSTFEDFFGYAFYNGEWFPIGTRIGYENGKYEYDVIFLLVGITGEYSDGVSGPMPVYFDNLLWDDLDEKYQSMKATWDDINT